MRCAWSRGLVRASFLFIFPLIWATPAQGDVSPLSLNDYSRLGARQTAATKVNDHIYMGLGFSNTFLVLTDDGNVVIDTSSAISARKHHQLLKEVSQAPVRYIILTHAHQDHTGGVALWKEPQTQIVAQRRFIEMDRYQARLSGYLSKTGAAQFGLDEHVLNAFDRLPRNHIAPTITFDDKYDFTLGGTKFELLSAPGETYDHLCVWVPRYKAAFVGDNFYDSFPNIYTLRGTQPRWALDYVASLDKILALQPEIVLPSHGTPIVGHQKIVERLTRYRDAILYVHDGTVKGMNDGKDVYTLMREIKLPPDLDVGEAYGKVAWSVRGIYEGYVGWFDRNPASMYDEPPTAAERELVRMAGGAQTVGTRAKELAKSGDSVQALRLAEAALSVDPKSAVSLEAKLSALTSLHDRSRNMIEGAWLTSAIRKTNRELAGMK
jgi:alkyl sulfatase BDS1-like metallo-beta-lactamase superfamily hydrolase